MGPAFRDLVRQCIHCGLCLHACPTYAVLGTETDAPRGRIALMRAVSEGRLGLAGAFDRHISLCLGCRSCETACPSGVPYGALLDISRAILRQARPPGVTDRFVRWLALRQLLPHVQRLRGLARALRLYQITGIQRFARRLGLLPPRLRDLEALLPPLPPASSGSRQPAPAHGARRATVAFFQGCAQEAFLPHVNRATLRVLQRNGFEVDVPAGQTCCGAAALHLGEAGLARRLARQNVDAFLARDGAAVIANAGGCGTVLKAYDQLLNDDPTYAEKARAFVSRVHDINEYLAAHLSVPPPGHVTARVAYVDPCHLRHVQKIVRQPRDLLRAIPGIELVEVKHADHCCGSAGVYNVLQADTARAVLDAKMADIARTQADTIATANTGCHLQLACGVRRAGLRARVVHVVELLDESYAAGRR